MEKISFTIDTAIQDLSDYHTGSTIQLRKYLTRSLDVASEAIMADLDGEYCLKNFYIIIIYAT